MKSSYIFKFLKGQVLRFYLIICLGVCLNPQTYSNPIEDLPMILEIHFGSGAWSIELMIPDHFGIDNLDNIRMTGLYDTAQFQQGIGFVPGEAFIVTEDDFQTQFDINQLGDFLRLEGRVGDDWWVIDSHGLCFGILAGDYFSEVSAPVGEESIACQMFSWSNGGPYFWTVKELPQTVGFSPWEVSKRATFSGYINDKNGEPMAGIKLDYCSFDFYHYTTPTVPEIFTDENGYFYTDNMFCKKYTFSFLYNDGEIGDTIIFIEPDSANYFEFKLDTLLTGIHEIKPVVEAFSIFNIPNPFSNQTTFVISASGEIQYQKGIIKIYNNEGYIVDIIPVEITGEKQELIYDLNAKSLASGIYFYSLEIGHQKKASGKMIVS